MIRALVLSVAMVSSASADPQPEPPPIDHLSRARDFHARGDFVHAREELLAEYRANPRPELLFALGQIEFNLHHYKAAIDYYERFTATNPDAEQAALAQQAIGAARIELARPTAPPPPPPKLPPHHQWELEDTGLVAFGGLAAAVGGGLLYYSHRLGNDRSGTLHAYDDRVDQARSARLAAQGCFAAGAIAISAALIHWRLHLVDTTIEVAPTPGGATISVARPL